jgi:glycerol-3-phosphate dehydrogenase (NAD(P)+)
MAERIAVIGSGSWGTALAISLATRGHAVTLWTRREALAAEMRETRKNRGYLPDAELPADLFTTSDLEEAVTGRKVLVFATPSQSAREVGRRVAPFVDPESAVVSVSKGIENETLMLPTEVLDEVLPTVARRRIGVLYGPSHAEEVAHGQPTAVVASAYTRPTAALIQRVFLTSRLRVYMNADIVGVQIGGSVKNVMAIAAGISDGVGFGDNAKAAIVTRGIAEMRRLGVMMGANGSTFSGLSGIGDLVVTCMSGLSRNRHLGEEIGRGKRLAEIESEMNMVAEGVRTTKSIVALARKYGIEMPITEAVHAILFEDKKPLEAVSELMTRAAKEEDWLPDEAVRTST